MGDGMTPNNDRRVNKLTTFLTHLKVYWWIWSIIIGGLITVVNSMEDVRSIPSIRADVDILKIQSIENKKLVEDVKDMKQDVREIRNLMFSNFK
jgi:hypothetical protein